MVPEFSRLFLMLSHSYSEYRYKNFEECTKTIFCEDMIIPQPEKKDVLQIRTSLFKANIFVPNVKNSSGSAAYDV